MVVRANRLLRRAASMLTRQAREAPWHSAVAAWVGGWVGGEEAGRPLRRAAWDPAAVPLSWGVLRSH